jgi:hypothetical protein
LCKGDLFDRFNSKNPVMVIDRYIKQLANIKPYMYISTSFAGGGVK